MNLIDEKSIKQFLIDIEKKKLWNFWKKKKMKALWWIVGSLNLSEVNPSWIGDFSKTIPAHPLTNFSEFSSPFSLHIKDCHVICQTKKKEILISNIRVIHSCLVEAISKYVEDKLLKEQTCWELKICEIFKLWWKRIIKKKWKWVEKWRNLK